MRGAAGDGLRKSLVKYELYSESFGKMLDVLSVLRGREEGREARNI